MTLPIAASLSARGVNMLVIFISWVRQRVQRCLGYRPHKQRNDSRDSCPLHIMTQKPHMLRLRHCAT